MPNGKAYPIPTNAISVIEAIKEMHPDIFVYGPLVRGMFTNCYSPYDDVSIITHKPEILSDLLKVSKKLVFVPLVSEGQRRDRGTRSAPSLNPSISLISSQFSDDVSDSDNVDEQKEGMYGFLTLDELKGLSSYQNLVSSNKNVFVSRIQASERLDFAPNIADSVYRFEAGGMVVYVHLLHGKEELDYIRTISDASAAASVHTAFINDKSRIESLKDEAIPDMNAKVLRFSRRTTMSGAEKHLHSAGWKVDSKEKLKDVPDYPSATSDYDEVAAPVTFRATAGRLSSV